MADSGTALVWSPRSNLELYGQTANIQAAINAGVEIALAPDWAITGSSNMLNELKVADLWNREQLGGRLSDRQLIDMATSIPAHIAGVDDR
jgi:cytosine/adenosine deaminase-related metal-dependent hydrolase